MAEIKVTWNTSQQQKMSIEDPRSIARCALIIRTFQTIKNGSFLTNEIFLCERERFTDENMSRVNSWRHRNAQMRSNKTTLVGGPLRMGSIYC